MQILSLIYSQIAKLIQPPQPMTETRAFEFQPFRRVSGEEQMSRLAEWATTSRNRSGTSNKFHVTAEDQLDAAAYALKELLGDLAKVMPVPQIRFGAEVYVLPDPATPAPARNASARMLQSTL